MELSPLVLQWREEALREGMQAERRATVENLLLARFGELDDQLLAIIEPLLELPSEEFTRLLLQLSNLSREDLLARGCLKKRTNFSYKQLSVITNILTISAVRRKNRCV